ncbi:MAG TPA: pyruvate kinase [Candidatus Ozemobacteraceae bacterium]
MRKTKILVTLGPSAETEAILEQLIHAGMNVARLNFSHGDHAEHGKRIEVLKAVRARLGAPVAMMLDTRGPEIRTGDLESETVTIETGSTITLTTRPVRGTAQLMPVSHPSLPSEVLPGTSILLDDGLIHLEVTDIASDTEITCHVVTGGRMRSRRGVNVPGRRLDLQNPTPRDREDLRFAAQQGFDYVAVSFTQDAATIEAVRSVLRDAGAPAIKVIAKIENHAGLDHFQEILEAADGIMVARGDLGVELHPEDVPIAQKDIIRRCYMAGKPVITATQMLHTMIESPRPTRAEVSDIANAIYDFTSALMLSGETSVGRYPVTCVETMARIAERAEAAIEYRKIFFSYTARNEKIEDTTAAVTMAAVTTACNVGAKAIITVSETGHTAQALSRLRSDIPIIAVVPDERVYRQLSLNWGVRAVLGTHFRSLEELHIESIRLAASTGLIGEGDTVVLVAGVPVGMAGATNMIKVETVGVPDDRRITSEAFHHSPVTGGTPSSGARQADLMPLRRLDGDLVVDALWRETWPVMSARHW